MPNLYAVTTLSVMPTWQCNASCTDCGTYSHPKNKVSLDPELTISAIDRAKVAGIKLIVFTGGEATLKLPDLLGYIRHATKLGLATRLVTNCWWAKTDYMARKTLSSLKEAGLFEINFSTGDEHARFIDVATVINAIVRSVEYGFHPYIMVELRDNALVTKKVVLDALAQRNPVLSDESLTIIESPWSPIDPKVIGDYAAGTCVNKDNLFQRVGCDSLFTTPTLQANGVIGVCCGIGMQKLETLQLGKFSPKDTDYMELCGAAELDTLKVLVKHFGPEKTLAMAAELNSNIAWENMYAHKCQACIRLFTDPEIRHEISAHEPFFLRKLTMSMATETVVNVIL